MSITTALFLALGLFTVYYLVIFTGAVRAARAAGEIAKPSMLGIATGAITNFLDDLGIGSYATTTSIFRSTKQVRDEKIPGTLNVGHTLPTVVEALAAFALFKTAISPVTLVEMIAAATAGAWLGARVFGRWPRRKIQIGMGFCLLAAVGVMFYRQVWGSPTDPAGGGILKLEGLALIIGVTGNFILGMLMTLGIGLYAPCMILISLLGMGPTAAYPVMMGSCAFLMPVASATFIKEKSWDMKASFGLLIGGIPAVLIAAFLVKSMPTVVLKWVVMAIVVYTAISMLMTARREKVMAPDLAPAATH
jgi:uncharacterized membrane protein YfcA